MVSPMGQSCRHSWLVMSPKVTCAASLAIRSNLSGRKKNSVATSVRWSAASDSFAYQSGIGDHGEDVVDGALSEPLSYSPSDVILRVQRCLRAASSPIRYFAFPLNTNQNNAPIASITIATWMVSARFLPISSITAWRTWAAAGGHHSRRAGADSARGSRGRSSQSAQPHRRLAASPLLGRSR